jgi:hypothetical protein
MTSKRGRRRNEVNTITIESQRRGFGQTKLKRRRREDTKSIASRGRTDGQLNRMRITKSSVMQETASVLGHVQVPSRHVMTRSIDRGGTPRQP